MFNAVKTAWRRITALGGNVAWILYGLLIIVGCNIVAFVNIGLSLNVAYGWTTPSAVLGLMYMIVVALAVLSPAATLTVFTFGLFRWWTRGRPDIVRTVDEAFGEILRPAFLWLMIVGAVPLMYSSMLPLENRGWIIPHALLYVAVFILFKVKWPKVFPGNGGKKLVFWSAVAGLGFLVINLFIPITDAFWIKTVGFVPLDKIRTTPTEEKLARIEKKIRAKVEKVVVDELDAVEKKVDANIPLTAADKAILNRYKTNTREKNALALALGHYVRVFDAGQVKRAMYHPDRCCVVFQNTKISGKLEHFAIAPEGFTDSFVVTDGEKVPVIQDLTHMEVNVLDAKPTVGGPEKLYFVSN